MSPVLHPVGPEPAQTYWVRRALVVGSLVAMIAVLIVVFANLGGGATAVPMATPTPIATEVESPARVTPTSSASSTPPPTASSSVPPTASPSVPSKESATPAPKASTSTPSAAPTGQGPGRNPAATPDCDPGQLRATITGKRTLRPEQKTAFTLSLINGSAETCLVTVDRDSFELKIYSGTDRIWTSRHCSTAVKAFDKKLKTQQDVEWTMRWDGRRSRTSCRQRPELPRPGIYWATAQFDGAKPVQLRMTLVG